MISHALVVKFLGGLQNVVWNVLVNLTQIMHAFITPTV